MIERPTKELLDSGEKAVPMAFFSGKLGKGQRKSWHLDDKETCAIVMALEKWSA